MTKTHYFNNSLKVGDRGENLLLDEYSFLEKDSCDAHDLIDSRNNNTIEVKTDTYDMGNTPNFFMEEYSDDKTFKLGGPKRSESHDTDIFLYQFIQNKIIFWFDDIPALVSAIDIHVRKNNLRLIRVKNKGYYTLGFKIPRDAVMHLANVIKLGDELPIQENEMEAK